ncbi:hypothetical protein ACP70R_019523 [Stipagrostis hirtigluma subsp. patula]
MEGEGITPPPPTTGTSATRGTSRPLPSSSAGEVDGKCSSPPPPAPAKTTLTTASLVPAAAGDVERMRGVSPAWRE